MIRAFFKNRIFIIIGILIIIIIPLLLLKLKQSPTTPPIRTTTIPTPIENTGNTLSTTPIPSLTQYVKQLDADKNVANHIQDLYTQFPWYSKLPLQSDNYFVAFDATKRQFIGRIYAQSNNLSADQVTTLESQITAQLKSFGVDTTQYPILWQTNL